MKLYRIRGTGISGLPIKGRVVIPKRAKAAGSSTRVPAGLINQAKKRVPMSGVHTANLGNLKPIRFRL